MSFFPIEDPQFWVVTGLALAALIFYLRRRKGTGGGSCEDCPER